MSVIEQLLARANAIKGEIEDLVTEARGSVEGLEETVTGLNGQLETIQQQRNNAGGLLETISESKETVALILGEAAAAALGEAETSTAQLVQQLDGIRVMTEDAVTGIENMVSEITVVTDADTGAGSTAEDVVTHLMAARQ